MAIYHLSAKVVSRGKGQSAVAAAAYRSGDPLVDERTGELKSYDKRSLRIIHKEIMAPAHAPAWARERNALWNAAERAEKRKDAQLAREIEVSLPHELTEQQRLYLVNDFAREAFVRRGYVVDLSIHTPDRGADGRNHHAHLMISMRVIGPNGFAPTKDRGLNSTEQLEAWRAQWANLANRHLARHGHDARIDHRSLEAQGIDREPTTHVGCAGKEMAARGAQSDRMDELNGILDRNGIRASIEASETELAELRDLVANENRQRRTEPAPSRETRTMTELPTDEELRKQPEREVQYLKTMEFQQAQARAILDQQRQAHEREQRITSYQQAKEIEAEEGRRKQAEQEATAKDRGAGNGDITDASVRYSIAIGQNYDVRDPYASLARAAGAESAAFLRTQQELKAEAAKETDPDKRQAIELRRKIEGCEYMAITSDRLAVISTTVTGRLDSPHAVADRQKAAHYRAQAEALREERSALLETVQAKATLAREQPASRAERAAAPADHAQMPVTAPERPAQPEPAYAPVHPTLPRAASTTKVAQPEPAPYVPVHPTLPRTAPAPNMAQPAAVPQQTARSSHIPEPRREPQPERPSPSPAPANAPAREAAPPAAVNSEVPREPARFDQRPFAAVALKPSYAVTMAKAAPSPSAAPVKDTGKAPEIAQPAVERAPSSELLRSSARTHYRSEMPATAPEPEAQKAPAGKGEKGKGGRAGDASAMPAPRRGDYRSLPSEVAEPRVTEQDGRDAGTLSSFLQREQPRTSEPRPSPTTGELLRSNALRGEHLRHQQQMQEERQNADKALGRIGSDMERKRPLQADDLRSLTREQWDSAKTKGEAGLTQSVKEAKDRGSQDRGREMTAPRRSSWEP